MAVIAASDPTIPMNSGVLDAVDFVMPPGTLVNPQYPASVNHYFPTSHVVYTCVLAALGKFNPARAVAPAGFGTGAIAIGYTKGRAGKPTVQYELMVTSLGGTSSHDGTSIVLPMNHFTPGHAGRNCRDRVSGHGAALRHLARFRGSRTPARRHRPRA